MATMTLRGLMTHTSTSTYVPHQLAAGLYIFIHINSAVITKKVDNTMDKKFKVQQGP